MILGLHINSTAPSRARKVKPADYKIEDFEILSTILSALMWRRHNGSIKLYTDSLGLSYYEQLGITDLWDAGIDTDTLDNLPANVNPDIFWASAKLFAIRHQGAPVAMVDTDLIIWKNIAPQLQNQQLACLHRENLIDCYLPFALLKKRKGYRPDPKWNWHELPCNTAFAYFGDEQFLNYYTDSAIDFMTDNNERPKELVSQMVFAEQRLLAMCAALKGIEVYSFLDDPFQRDNDTFTHLWGAKDVARHQYGKRALLCKSLIKRIREHFPEYQLDRAGLDVILNEYLFDNNQ